MRLAVRHLILRLVVAAFVLGGSLSSRTADPPASPEPVAVIVVGVIQNVSGSGPTGGAPAVRSISGKTIYARLTDPRR